MPQTVLEVQGMSCEHCVAAVEGALRSVPGVRVVIVDLKEGRAEIQHSEATSPELLVAAIEEEGYQAKPGS